MATGGCEQTSDETFNFKCTPCARKNRKREAVKYCVECQGYCCESCVDMHEAFPTLEGHQLLDKSDFKSTVLTSNIPEIPTVRCNIHEVKVLDMYCGNHDVVGCTSCMAIDHRTCTDVHLIQDIINTAFKRSDAEKISQKLQENIKKFEKIIKARVSLLNELKQSKTEAIKAITNFRKDMESILANLEKESLKDVEREFGERKGVLEQEKSKAEDGLVNMKQADGDLKNSEENKAQQFVCMKTAQQKVTSAEDTINRLESPFYGKVNFYEDTNIQDVLNRLISLGSINIRASKSMGLKTSVYSITGSRDINIRLPNESSNCVVYGSCLSESGMLLLADHANKRLKSLDIDKMSLVDSCDLPNAPYSVCVTNKHEAAVSFYTNTVQFVSLGTKMTPTRSLNFDHRCLGVAYKDNTLYITENGFNLYIHDMSGTLLKTVTKDSCGNNLLTCSWQAAFSDSGDKIFVVDWGNRVIILDIQGNYISTTTDTELASASGVCTDGRGNIFVCGHGSHNVIQIGQDGKKKGVLAKSSDGLSNPCSVCFVQKQQALFVTQANNDLVKMFNLK